jgi:hypothetical protein
MHPEPNPQEIELMRWLDGEMTPAQSARFEQELTANDALRQEAASLKSLSLGLKNHFPKSELSNPDFFNHQIQEAIATERKASHTPAPTPQSVWSWLFSPWAVGAAAAAIALMAITWPTARVSQVISSYAPNPDIQVEHSYNSTAQATVLILTGLEDMPAAQPLVGYHISRSETDSDLATTRLYDPQGQIVALLTQNARNEPSILSR